MDPGLRLRLWGRTAGVTWHLEEHIESDCVPAARLLFICRQVKQTLWFSFSVVEVNLFFCYLLLDSPDVRSLSLQEATVGVKEEAEWDDGHLGQEGSEEEEREVGRVGSTGTGGQRHIKGQRTEELTED